MSDNTIGILMITTKTAVSPKTSSSAPQGRERETAALTAEAVTRQAPPPPGMGKLVDKTA
jgi:hypothetical protein